MWGCGMAKKPIIDVTQEFADHDGALGTPGAHGRESEFDPSEASDGGPKSYSTGPTKEPESQLAAGLKAALKVEGTDESCNTKKTGGG